MMLYAGMQSPLASTQMYRAAMAGQMECAVASIVTSKVIKFILLLIHATGETMTDNHAQDIESEPLLGK